MKKILLVAGVLAFAVGFACHKRKHKSPTERAEWLASRIEKKLELDETQKQKLTAIKDEFVAKHKAQADSMRDDLAFFSREIRKESLAKKELLQTIERRQKERQAFEAFVIDKVVEFHKILKPEQREKAAAMIEEFSSRFTRKD